MTARVPEQQSSGGAAVPMLSHVLLTRFNLPSVGVESLIRAREGWLRERVVLFEKYCLPSVLAQDCQNFEWIVYFDPESPAWLHRRIDTYRETGVLTAVLRTEVPREQLRSDIAAVVDPRTEVLITTNLDNDDGIARDFVSRLQAVAAPAERVAVYLTTGLIKSPRGVYVHHDPNNAFCSVREPYRAPVTCWSDWHNLLSRSMPAVAVDSPPAWLQVVHGANVSNRVRGRLVAPGRYAPRFGRMLDDVPQPTRGALLRDGAVFGPARAVREAGRAGVKKALVAVGGTDGLDRVKARMRSLTSHRPSRPVARP